MRTKKAIARKGRRNSATSTAQGNRISAVVYETAKDLYGSGAIGQTTMRKFDVLCLPKVPKYSPRQIKAIRDRCQASQAVFSSYMNISPSSLQKWESGARKPDNVALKLLSLIDQKGLEALI